MEYMGARERCPYECGQGSTHAHNRYSAPQLDDPLHEKGGPRIKQKPSELMYIWGWEGWRGGGVGGAYLRGLVG